MPSKSFTLTEEEVLGYAKHLPRVEFRSEPTPEYLWRSLRYYTHGMGKFRLNGTASPGAPWDRYVPDIKTLFEFDELVEEVSHEAYRFLTMWRDLPEDVTPLDLFLRYSGPMGLVMIKNEPHPARKRLTGAYRIIVKVPLCVQLAMRVVFGDWIDQLISAHESSPLKPGMGLHDEGRAALYQYAGQLSALSGGKLVEQDVSSWDWCLSWEHLVQWDRVVISATGASPAWAKMIRNSTRMNCSMPFMSPGGEILIWADPHGQRSGGLRTAESNSGCNMLLENKVRDIPVTVPLKGMFMGDDSVGIGLGELDPAIVAQNWGDYGFKLSLMGVSEHSDGFEFCSTHFTHDGPQLLSWPRVVFRFLSRHTLPGEWEQFMYELRGIDGSQPPGVDLSEIVSFMDFLGRSGKPPGINVVNNAQDQSRCSSTASSSQEEAVRAPQSGSPTSF